MKIFRLVRESLKGSSSTHPTVQDYHVTGVRGQPGLHRFANGANSVQGRSVKVRPTVVLHLEHSRGSVCVSGLVNLKSLFAIKPLSDVPTSQADVNEYLWGKSGDVMSLL